MRSLGLQLVLLLLILGVCIASFLLPAINMDAIRPGYIACMMSVTVLTSIEPSAWLSHLYLGSFWIANLFMLASPFGLWRARLGKGGVFIALMLFWDLLTLSYFLYHRLTGNYASVLIGWCVWEASLFAMTLLLLIVRTKSVTSS
jgi:hypothetical protein